MICSSGFNQFHPGVTFLYPLKKSEYQMLLTLSTSSRPEVFKVFFNKVAGLRDNVLNTVLNVSDINGKDTDPGNISFNFIKK